MAAESRETIETNAPSCASARATEKPRPLLAPATIATLPFRPRSIPTSVLLVLKFLLRKNSKNRHSERRFCAKNPSQPFVLNQEEFFASLSNDDQWTFSARCLAAEAEFAAASSRCVSSARGRYRGSRNICGFLAASNQEKRQRTRRRS